MSISQRLREERTRLALNQTEFGNAGGVTKEAQSNYERGKRKPDSDYWSNIDKIGADIQYILTGRKSITNYEIREKHENTYQLNSKLEKLKKELDEIIQIVKQAQ
ncbi:helix-turn-helix transcriptional regulator [Candidatus Albibeggiatoa sp. nov. BB20]|uniref:helix-turn-helix domain-containing protein n=1 Tax=Candidatus Albibeggiatoa sp. nov. BB20 TaxID=3162723 RepID=UPI0033656424